MFDWLSNPAAWIGLLTLTVLEIVLGIDNIVFISILTGKLPESQRDKARKIGLSLALITRILLLLSISWVVALVYPVFSIGIPGIPQEARDISWRDMILLGGGLFLIWKSVKEIHAKFEGEEHHGEAPKAVSFGSVIGQILLLDVIFSLDSVITAVGMSDEVDVMIVAVVIAIGFMLFFSGSIARFVEANPTVKMLALAFLVLIGANLVAEGLGAHIPKGYTYFAMAFAVVVEMLNLKLRDRNRRKTMKLQPNTVIKTD